MIEAGAWKAIPFVAASLGVYYLFVKRNKNKVSQMLTSRPQLTHREFGAIYFGESKLREALAVEVRNILSHHLPVSVEGLSPQDKFQEHLMMDTFDSLSSAEFIIKVEEKYGISIRDDVALKSDITFGQLIDHIEQRVVETNMAIPGAGAPHEGGR
ncbi:MAG: acyl carrier protein [Nitrospira sp.]|nr:acyl carrier protein [Nitrospira sp.]